ncbi:MAG: L-seryl-tRNA(Sec) selenium transferase [bacterium]|nr:L-seryl-tRNA(Sec) selenium transferase [bacterium]
MTVEARADLLRQLPAVDILLGDAELAGAHQLYGRRLVRVQAGVELERLRERVLAGEDIVMDREVAELPSTIRIALESRYGKPLERVLNATGILLHTNLGRAPLPRAIAGRLPDLLNAYCDLEFDLGAGRRVDRNHRAARLLEAATGAPAAVVVNNNAAAMVLVLAVLAVDREVIVSRGELVEIGGSFRIPELLEATGCRLVEVGTTNRTRLADYERAIGPQTAMLLKVFPSNYRQAGYVASVSPGDLVALGRSRAIPLLVDEGSGLLQAREHPQLRDHPSLEALLRQGCDLVCGSGDKLLGGPQAGLLLGSSELVERCRHHPLYRALRPDRTTLAALEGVLRRHLAGNPMPLDRLWPDETEHRGRLEALAPRLGAEIVPADAFLGGGSAPDQPVPGLALALPDTPELASALRLGSPPVVGYSRRGRFVLDLRTVEAEDDEVLATAVLAGLRKMGIDAASP